MKAILGVSGDHPDDDTAALPPLPVEIHVAIVLPDTPKPIASEVMMAIDAAVSEHGYRAVVRNTGGGYMVSARRQDSS